MNLRLNIQYKITLIVAATVGIILTGIYLYLNKNLKEHTYQLIHANLLKESTFTKSILENNVGQNIAVENFSRLADHIGQDLKLRVTIVSGDGAVLGDSELNDEHILSLDNHLYRPEVQGALKNGFGESRRYSTTMKKEMLYMAYLLKEGKMKGTILRLSIPLSVINIISDNLKNMLILSLILAFIMASFIGLGASFFVSKPIKDISLIARGIAEGNYSRRISISTNDELEELGVVINHMSEQIKSKIDEIISNKSRFEAILLSMFEGVMVIDQEGSILLVNETLKKFLNIKENSIGRKPLEVLRNIELHEIVNSILVKKNKFETREISILLPEEKTLQVHAAAVIRNKTTDGAVLVFHDITELRRLEIVRRDFIANVSHEIRTPITNIKGYAETLLDGALDDKKNAKEFLRIIEADSTRLSMLVDDLLDLSRIESGKLNLIIAPNHLISIIDRVVVGLKKQLQEKRISVIKKIPKDLPAINVDLSSMTQVFLNLVDNGIKYSEPDTSIAITAKEAGKDVQIDITDHGIGIPQEDIPRIFERFYRVDKARSRDLGGTGLGLSIVKHIIQSHNGKITVTSELSKGSTFSLFLPKA